LYDTVAQIWSDATKSRHLVAWDKIDADRIGNLITSPWCGLNLSEVRLRVNLHKAIARLFSLPTSNSTSSRNKLVAGKSMLND